MRTLTAVLTKRNTQVWLSGKMIAKVSKSKRNFDFMLEGKKAHISIENLGQKKKVQKGTEQNWDAKLTDFLYPEMMKGYVEPLPKKIPDMTVVELFDFVKSLVHNKPASKFTQEEWDLYNIRMFLGLHPELIPEKPVYVETDEYENFQCILAYKNKNINAFVVRENTDNCVWPKNSIIVAWHIDEAKHWHFWHRGLGRRNRQ